MLSIEDCLEQLDVINWDPPTDDEGKLLSITNTWDRRFISDVSFHTRMGKPISTAQGTLALKLIQRYHNELVHSAFADYQLQALQTTPHYRLAPHESTSFSREVRWIGDSKLAFRCKYNPSVGDDIKRVRSNGIHQINSNARGTGPRFVKDHKLWVVNVDTHNVERVMELIRRHCFKFDDAVAEFLTEVSNSKNTASSAQVTPEGIRVEVRDDEFLNAVLNDLKWMH